MLLYGVIKALIVWIETMLETIFTEKHRPEMTAASEEVTNGTLFGTAPFLLLASCRDPYIYVRDISMVTWKLRAGLAMTAMPYCRVCYVRSSRQSASLQLIANLQVLQRGKGVCLGGATACSRADSTYQTLPT